MLRESPPLNCLRDGWSSTTRSRKHSLCSYSTIESDAITRHGPPNAELSVQAFRNQDQAGSRRNFGLMGWGSSTRFCGHFYCGQSAVLRAQYPYWQPHCLPCSGEGNDTVRNFDRASGCRPTAERNRLITILTNTTHPLPRRGSTFQPLSV